MSNSTKRRPPLGARVCQLKVSLRSSKPPIWRRLLIKDNTSLHRLHLVIQDAMGWQNSHLYQFDTGEVRYTEYFDDGFVDDDEVSASATRFGDLKLRKGDRIGYLYDFGDNWLHEIQVEAVSPVDRGSKYPRCIGGRRACPPEDCGGIYGYDRMLSVLRAKTDPERQEYLEWLGGAWDADAFSVEATDDFIAQSHGGKAP